MHENRTLYSYSEYKDILLSRWKSTYLWLTEKQPESFHSLFFAQPAPKTLWLPGSPRRKYFKRLQAKLKHQTVRRNSNYTFATLTYSTEKYTRKAACLLMKDHMKEFMRLLRKRYKRIQYFWIVELTKARYPHYHIIFDRFVHWRVLRAIWYKVSGNSVTNIKAIPGGGAAGYVTKYLAKTRKNSEEYFDFMFKHIDRLWSSSRSFFYSCSPPDRKYIALAISFGCHYTRQYTFKPSDHAEFWEVDIDYWYPLLYYNLYIDRRLCQSEESFDARCDILSYFQDPTPYINKAEKLYLSNWQLGK